MRIFCKNRVGLSQSFFLWIIFALAMSVGGAAEPLSYRLLVKLKPPLVEELEFSLSPEASQIDRPTKNAQAWLAKHNIVRAHPLYPELVRAKKQTGKSHRQLADDVRKKFPVRSARHRGEFAPPDLSRTYVIELPLDSASKQAAALDNLRQDPQVEFVQPDQSVHAYTVPNDPYFSSQGSWGQSYADLYGLNKIQCPGAWDLTTGTGVLVAVVDTGIDYTHPDITNQVWINSGEIPGNGIDDDGNGFVDDVRGWDFIGTNSFYENPDNNPFDGHGHGTHVAGTIAAEGNNGLGVVGVAWGAKVMAVKGLDDTGRGTDSALAKAIRYAVDNGADIINASWGGPGYSSVIEQAVSYATNMGVVFIVAAGNDNADIKDYYPAGLRAVICVSALDADDQKASFSNFGDRMEVAAPGVDVLSLRATNTALGTALNSGYTRAKGTSMAAPHVAGVAALILSLHPTFGQEDIRQVLRASASDVLAPDFDSQSGYGQVNASNAVRIASVLQARILAARSMTIASPITLSGWALGPTFANYTMEYRAANASNWTVFQQGTAAVDHGVLGVFDCRYIADGLYQVRLRVFDDLGNCFPDTISITVRRDWITQPNVPQFRCTASIYKPGASIVITGTIAGLDLAGYKLDWARGITPSSGWSTAGITLSSSGFEGTNKLLGVWNTPPFSEADFYTIRLQTLRPTFTNDARTWIYVEPELYSTNWPVYLARAPNSHYGVLPAHDSAGRIRLVLANLSYSYISGRVLNFDLDGSSQTNLLPLPGPRVQPAIADHPGSLGQDIVIMGEKNELRVFHPDGSTNHILLTNNLEYSFLTMADLDGDGAAEILALGRELSGTNGFLYALKTDGRLVSTNFPIPIANATQSGLNFPAIRTRILPVDFNMDGKSEIVALALDAKDIFSLRVYQPDGTPYSWPSRAFHGVFMQMAAGDLNNDGRPEIIVGYSDTSYIGRVEALDSVGAALPGWPFVLRNAGFTLGEVHLAIADLDRDGTNEIIFGSQCALHVLRANGTNFWRSPIVSYYNNLGTPVVADIDGDGFPEIIVGRDELDGTTIDHSRSADSVYTKLIAYRRDQTIARTWHVPGMKGNQPFAISITPVVGDFDRDGRAEIALNYLMPSEGGLGGALAEGALHLLKLDAPYRPHPSDWPMNFHDPQNTANALVPASLRASAAGDVVTVTWPFQQAKSFLEASEALAGSPWKQVAPLIYVTNGLNTAVIPKTNAWNFFRLQYEP